MHKSGIAVRSLTVIAAVVLVLTSLSCSGKKTVAFKTAPFALDSSQLAQPVIVPELGLQFSPPLGWQEADSARLVAFRNMQASSELFDKFYPVYCLTLYMDSTNGAIAYVARINDDGAAMPDVAERYKDFLDKRLPTSSVIAENYRIDHLDIYYYLYHTDQVINYKLLGQTQSGGKFLVEYVCAGDAFPALEGAITSSIASLENSGAAAAQPKE
jgi:hypothetical protein